MYCVDDAQRRVLQLEAPASCPIQFDASSASVDAAPRPSRPIQSKPAEEDWPYDVVLHADECAFPLHLAVLRRRCPSLHKLLLQLRHRQTQSGAGFHLRLWEGQHFCTKECSVSDKVRERVRLDYVRCVNRQEELPEPRRKRQRQDNENRPPNQRAPRARSLFKEESKHALQPRAMHVEIVGAELGAVVTLVEYIYRFKVRVADEAKAIEAARLAQWLGMRDTMRYYCLTIANRHATSATWMELLIASSTLSDRRMRRVLVGDLVKFLATLRPDDYCQVLTDIRPAFLTRVKSHDTLVRAVAGLIDHVRLIEFWRLLLDGLARRLCDMFQTAEIKSLRSMHKRFAPEWKPYLERAPVEVGVIPGQAHHFTLLQFGKFQLQVRIVITDEMPIQWRIIRTSSPQLLTAQPDEITKEELAKDPEFWMRGQMKVKYWRADAGKTEVSEVVNFKYKHCYHEYGQWSALVPPSPSTVSAAVTTPAVPPEKTGRAQFRGKFFVWGDPVCSQYHFLLQSTLFHAAPHSATTELSDLMVVSEMQRLPVETLVLVLRSDRLQVPGGERTLLRCLNKMVFGNNFSYLASSVSNENGFHGRAKDIVRLYKCVRWCFVPLDDIIVTLKRSPRELRFYELILKGLQDTFKRFQRQLPWGWRRYKHAYLKNETNPIEFMIEAGENHLSPDYFPRVKEKLPLSQESASSQTTATNAPFRAHSIP